MKVIWGTQPTGDRVVALGMFDGVHRGHQALIQEAKKLAGTLNVPLQVCTFDRHPMEILCPEKAPGLLTTLWERLMLLYRVGADEVRLLRFTPEVANLSPDAFLKQLRQMTGIRGVVAGWNYSFGRGGQGNAEHLLQDGERHACPVRILDPVYSDQGRLCSSSEIRKCLAEGQLVPARHMLGHAYRLSGRIVAREGLREKPLLRLRIPKRKQLPLAREYQTLFFTRNGFGAGDVLIPDNPSKEIILQITEKSVIPEDEPWGWLDLLPDVEDDDHLFPEVEDIYPDDL